MKFRGYLRSSDQITKVVFIWGQTYLDQIVHKGLSFQSFYLNSSKIDYHGSFPYLHHQNWYTMCMIVWNVTKRTYRIVDRSLKKRLSLDWSIERIRYTISRSCRIGLWGFKPIETSFVVAQPIRAPKILPGLSHGHRQQNVAWSSEPSFVKSFQFDFLLISVNWIP